MTTEWRRGEFTLSTDHSRIDVDAVHAFLTQSYWSPGIPRETVARAIAHSLCFALHHGGRTIGLTRVITDRATFAYLCDVYVLEEFRGHGLARWMLEIIHAHPELQGFRRWLLATRDAHRLYEKFGYEPLGKPANWLNRHVKDPYRS